MDKTEETLEEETYTDKLATIAEFTKLVNQMGPGAINHPSSQQADNSYLEDVVRSSFEQSGMLAGIEGLQIARVPIGRALVGGTVALAIGEIIDGFVPHKEGETGQSTLMRGAIKGVAAGVVANLGFLDNFLGRRAREDAALLLTFDAERDILPLDDLVGKFVGIFKPKMGQLFGKQSQSHAVHASGGSNGYYSALPMLANGPSLMSESKVGVTSTGEEIIFSVT